MSSWIRPLTEQDFATPLKFFLSAQGVGQFVFSGGVAYAAATVVGCTNPIGATAFFLVARAVSDVALISMMTPIRNCFAPKRTLSQESEHLTAFQNWSILFGASLTAVRVAQLAADYLFPMVVSKIYLVTSLSSGFWPAVIFVTVVTVVSSLLFDELFVPPST